MAHIPSTERHVEWTNFIKDLNWIWVASPIEVSYIIRSLIGSDLFV